MRRLTKEIFDRIKARVEERAKELSVGGVLAIGDCVTGAVMYAFVNCEPDSAIRDDNDGNGPYNIVAIAFAKLAMVLTHLKNTGGETKIAGEVPWKGGHISENGEFGYAFSGAPQEVDLELARVAEETHCADIGEPASMTVPQRRKLPDERTAVTHKFDIAGHEGYITVGLYEDGTPGEIFLVMAKEGSTISGFADAFAQAISYALQYGVPLQVLVDKFSHVRFEPSGMTKNPDIRYAKSIVDYVFRWLEMKFLSTTGSGQAVLVPATPAPVAAEGLSLGGAVAGGILPDAPPCSVCGAIMVQTGSVYTCRNCGHTTE